METKTSSLAIKKAGEGKATVVIATLGVKDRDGDVLLPGAFGEQVVPVVGAHEWKMPPIGKARVFEHNNEAIAEIEFNETTEGQNWYRALKFDWDHPPSRQEYSWGFQVPATHTHRGKHNNEDVRFLHGSADGQPLPIFEVSPVLVGAGKNTRSLSVKAFDDLPEAEEHPGSFDDLKAAGVRVQSLVFPKSKWESAEAVRAWLRSHDFRTELDATGSSWRARQEDPSRFSRLRSFCINPSRDASSDTCRVMAVGGPMKESRGVEAEHTQHPTQDAAELKGPLGIREGPPTLESLMDFAEAFVRKADQLIFLEDLRQRKGKSLNVDVKALAQRLAEKVSQLCAVLKLDISDRAPVTSELDERREQWNEAIKSREDVEKAAEQEEIDALVRRNRARQARIDEWQSHASW